MTRKDLYYKKLHEEKRKKDLTQRSFRKTMNSRENAQ
jgi:hypothetical protein